MTTLNFLLKMYLYLIPHAKEGYNIPAILDDFI